MGNAQVEEVGNAQAEVASSHLHEVESLKSELYTSGAVAWVQGSRARLMGMYGCMPAWACASF